MSNEFILRINTKSENIAKQIGNTLTEKFSDIVINPNEKIIRVKFQSDKSHNKKFSKLFVKIFTDHQNDITVLKIDARRSIAGLIFFPRIQESEVKDFLERPRNIIYPKLDQAKEGILGSLNNSWKLLDSSKALFKAKQYELSVAILLLAMEEIGKALMIVDKAKKAENQGVRNFVVRKFQDHDSKIKILMNELCRSVSDPRSKNVTHIRGALNDWISIIKSASEILDKDEQCYVYEFDTLRVNNFIHNIPRFFSNIIKEYAMYFDYNGQVGKWSTWIIKDSGIEEKAIPPVIKFIRICILEYKSMIEKSETIGDIGSIYGLFKNMLQNLSGLDSINKAKQKANIWLKDC